MATDSQGYLYVAGTTSSLDFPVKGAWQPQMGESRVMRSTDGGVTWAMLANTPADITVIQPDLTNAQTVFAAGDSGIYKSADGGQTWRTVHMFPATSIYAPWITGLALDPGSPTHLIALELAGVLVSSDAGETWSPGYRFSPGGCFNQSPQVLAFDPFGSGAVLMGCDNAVYLSYDRGVTFSRMGLYPDGGGSTIAAFDPWHAGWYWAASSSGVQGHLYLSMDGFQTWTEKTS